VSFLLVPSCTCADDGYLFFFSSGDSTGLNIDQQKAQFKKAVDNHMDSIVSLQHDVHCMFSLLFHGTIFDVSLFI